MANRTESHELFQECETFLRNSITKDNFYDLYEFANQQHMHEMNGLKDAIFANIHRMFKSKMFLTI